MSELKKCPFCGKSDIHIEQKGTFFWCECYDCGAISREHHTLPGVNVLQSEDIARGYWNQRPLEDALHARIAELEAEIERLTVHSDIERQDDKCSGHGDISNFPPVMGSGDGLGW